MKTKYPAEAFALGIVLFSAGMKEAFISGILVVLSVVFGEFLKNLLEDKVPLWSLRACVCIGTGAVCVSAFTLGFAVTGTAVSWALWLMIFLIGILAAKHVLTSDLKADYDGILWESAILWGFWILFAIAREILTAGSIFGFSLFTGEFQSKSFGSYMFGFLAAGMALAFTNGILKKKCLDTQSLLLAVPMILFARPFEMKTFGGVIGAVWVIGVSVAMFISIKKTLKFSRPGAAYRGLPAEMLSMGFLYMLLSIY